MARATIVVPTSKQIRCRELDIFPALVVHDPHARTIQKIQMYDWLADTLASQRQFNVTLHRPDDQGQMQWPLIQRVAIRNGVVLFDGDYAKYIEKI